MRAQLRGRRSLAYATALSVAIGLIGGVASGTAANTKEYGYVTKTLALPATNSDVHAYGRDIDRDGQRDNVLGQFLADLDQNGLDLQTDLSAAVERGDLLMLHSLRTPSFASTKDATWQVLFGEETDNPDFSGLGSFTVDGSAPRSSRMAAKIKNNRVKSVAGAIPLRLDILGRGLELGLKKAKILATCSKTSCASGRINGVITTQTLNNYLLPELSEHFTAIVQRDCTMPGQPSGGCMSDSTGKSIFLLFDGDDNLVITEEELRQNSLIPLTPDLDLVKANGKPGRDGEADAMSMGLGFEAVRAQLNSP